MLDHNSPELDDAHLPLLFEMIRSFVAVAEHLNVTQAVRALSSTRQTVKRHIEGLEAAMGVKLFDITERKYQLTDEGIRALETAHILLAQGKLWLRGQMADVNGLRRLNYTDETGWAFYSQQQPISIVWSARSRLLRDTLSAWVQSKGQLESAEMAGIRPYILVYRESEIGWLLIEIGEESLYSKWYGWATARSSIGRSLSQMPGGPEIARVMELPFGEVNATHGVRIDQVATYLPQTHGGDHKPICFNRLLMKSAMPDGSPVLIVVADRPDDITISGLSQEFLENMPATEYSETTFSQKST